MQLDRPGVQALRSKHFRSRFAAPETALTALEPVLMRSISSADRAARDARSGKLSAAERSALNQALAKALAFRDAGKIPEARQWTAELVRLLKSHDLLRDVSAPFLMLFASAGGPSRMAV